MVVGITRNTKLILKRSSNASIACPFVTHCHLLEIQAAGERVCNKSTITRKKSIHFHTRFFYLLRGRSTNDGASGK